MVAKYSHDSHAFKNLMKLLGINQMRAIDLGHLIYSHILGYSALGWCVCPGQGFLTETLWVFACHMGVFQDFHWSSLGSTQGKHANKWG